MAESITLQTSDSGVISGDILGRLSFAASNEASNYIAVLIGGSISAEAEEDFTSINNATSLVFSTSSSGNIGSKIKITSSGNIIPASNNLCDIGSSANYFRQLYVSSGNFNQVLVSGTGVSVSGHTHSVSSIYLTNNYLMVGSGSVGSELATGSHGYILRSVSGVPTWQNATVLGLVIGTDVQAYDAGLTSIAGLTTAADRYIYTSANDVYTTGVITAFGRSLVDDADASTARTTLGLAIGTNVQAYDAGLATIAGLTTAEDRYLYTVAQDLYVAGTITAFGRSLVDDTDAATSRTTLGLVIGTDVQAYDAGLTSIAALTTASGSYLFTTANDVYTTGISTAYGRSVLASSGVESFVTTTLTAGTGIVLSYDSGTDTATINTSGLVIGTDVQAYDAGLTSIAGLTTAADRYIYTTSNDVYTTGVITSFGRSLVDDADASTSRTTLGVVIGTDVAAIASPTFTGTVNAAALILSGALTVAGTTTVKAGTALLPSIIPSGDTDTGIWFPLADTVGVSTSGIERVRVDSAGNIGLGGIRIASTATPSTYWLTTQANAGLTICHAAKGGTLDLYQPKRNLSAYTYNTISTNYGIMRIRIPAASSTGFRFTIKHTGLIAPAYSRSWEINCADYYSGNSIFGTNSISVEGAPDFSRIRLMENTSETIWNSVATRYLILGQVIAGVGTVSNITSTTSVTGSGTKFTHLFKVGDGILINSLWYYISAIAGDTSLTVSAVIALANTSVAYSKGDTFAASQITIDVDQLHVPTLVQMNTAFAIDFADTEATLSLVTGVGRDITLNNTNAQHGFVGIGTQSPSNLLHVSQQKLGRGTVSNSASGTTLTGVNTVFLDTFKVGDSITVPHIGASGTPQTVAISAIASNTSMTTATITAANAAGSSYSLAGGTVFSVAGNGKMTAAIASTFAGGRLTLESGVAISSTDQTAKTTIYYTPNTHSLIGLYDETTLAWTAHPFTQKSLALGTLVSGKNYDVFAALTSGAVAIEALVWTSDSARATILNAVDGVWLKNGDMSRRYVGTFRTVTTTTTEDSEAKRFVYNVNNQVSRSMLGVLGYVNDNAVATFTFNSQNVWAALNSGSGNKCEWVNGLTETVFLAGAALYSAGAGSFLMVGVGIDSTTSASFIVSQNDTAGGACFEKSNNKSVPFAAGYHFSSLNGAVVSANVAATIYRDDSRYGGTVDPIRTFISGSINS